MTPFNALKPGDCFTLASDWAGNGPVRTFVKVDGQHGAFASGPHGQSYRIPVPLAAETIGESAHAGLLATWFPEARS